MAYEPKLIVPPWKGVVDNVPSILAPSSSFGLATGFWVEQQRLRSSLNRSAFPLWPGVSDGPIVGERSFMDAIGNIHTVIVTANSVYYYSNGTYTLLTSTNWASLLPVKFEVYQNTLIYTNGFNSPGVADGSAFPSSITLPNNGSCFFLGKLAGRMLYLYLIEPGLSSSFSVGYPRRFRWSQVNNANNFTDFTAGVADIPDIESNITGYATQGALGYIYHNRGITTVTPTGGISPTFYLEPYTEGRGIGNFYPYTLAQYGNLTVFAAEAEINAFNPLLGPPQPIGGTAARSIYADLYQEAGNPIGAITPTYIGGQQGLVYWLAIPLANNTSKVWQYQFDSQTWTAQTYPFNVTCIDLIAVS